MIKRYYRVEMFGEDIEDNVVVVRGHGNYQKDISSILGLGGVKAIYLTDYEGNDEKLIYKANPSSGERIEISDDIETHILYRLKMLNNGVEAIQEYVSDLHDQIGELRGRAVSKEARTVFNDILKSMTEDIGEINEIIFGEENM